MATVQEVADGLAARLATIAGLRAHDVWPAQAVPPAGLVRPTTLSSRTAMGLGRRVFGFEVVLLAAPLQPDQGRAQRALNPYLDETGAKSVIAALEADRTLGGKVATLDVQWRDYGAIEVNLIAYAGAIFEVTIWP